MSIGFIPITIFDNHTLQIILIYSINKPFGAI